MILEFLFLSFSEDGNEFLVRLTVAPEVVFDFLYFFFAAGTAVLSF